MTMRYLLATLMLTSACAAPPQSADGSQRGGAGKADAPGECTADTCGGQGAGGCYCDAECQSYGDCCSNYEAVCESNPSDSGPSDSGSVPEFGTDATRHVEVLATAEHGLNEPRDLAFDSAHPDELFIVNQGNNSVSVIEGFGTSNATISTRSGPGSQHFCAKPSALAFGRPGSFATAQEEDQITQPTTPWDFMGPTLWSDDLSIFDAGHDSHLDMLHNSPNGAGIAYWEANKYFVFDGEHESITMYDFEQDHGAGGADHSDGIVRRYVEGQVGYVHGIPSHMEFHDGLLYVADTGNDRIAVLDPAVGSLGDYILPNYDGSDQRYVVGGSIETLVNGASANLQVPSGLAIHGGRLFVSDEATGEIVAFDIQGNELGRIDTGAPGIMGITVGPDGDLYFINGVEQTLGHVAR